MSKTFHENYYDSDDYGMKKVGKSHKHSRQKVKDCLRKIDFDSLEEDEDLKEEIEEELDK